VVFRAELTNLPVGIPVYLEDKKMGTFTSLHEPGSFYSVSIASKSEGTGRFFMHTNSAATGINPDNKEADFAIIPHPKNNSIRIIGRFGNNAEIAVYDMAGRKLLTRNLNNSELNDVNMGGLVSGFYLVSVRSEIQEGSKKISWVKNQ
jgi:myo-inositol-hexaphosphate 3-phosphohydrolase